ncbi:L,D-transpeptidase [Gellertiella hungarica]|uniref:Lipoprotein-anchoring transpeptidase ErfK/SrfK n=1 Tax=Gellertiella hungarica TaxID=1572859 RepID=A0A7W6NJY1_9HYPH|nr:L,D-transpeptidase [Gellertiella hungarica]MBB4064283.1 lipoprotein-anchoring transpeptidase ErfK/SrfK [Gellertiella hungarica]
MKTIRMGLAMAGLVAGMLAADMAAAQEPALARNSRAEPTYNTHRQVPQQFKRRLVRLATDEAPGTIIIDTNNKFLYLVEGGNRAIRYGVGVGKEGFGWSGVVKVGRKQEWPDWTPPPEMRAREAAKGHFLPVHMKGGEDNPLGARAMYLYRKGRDTAFRIHGTNQPWSIGLNLSSGCIRMMNKDVIDLYSRVAIGAKVIVIGPGNKQGKVNYEDRGLDFFRTLFGG